MTRTAAPGSLLVGVTIAPADLSALQAALEGLRSISPRASDVQLFDLVMHQGIYSILATLPQEHGGLVSRLIEAHQTQELRHVG
jgi:hypothetical protein